MIRLILSGVASRLGLITHSLHFAAANYARVQGAIILLDKRLSCLNETQMLEDTVCDSVRLLELWEDAWIVFSSKNHLVLIPQMLKGLLLVEFLYFPLHMYGIT
jgi:hypothetical protein